jgi:sialidase-1
MKYPRLVFVNIFLAIAGSFLVVKAAAQTENLEFQDLFVSGAEGYHTFRIPSLVVTPTGTVLAFVEGRRAGSGDSGDIDLLLRRSEDGGHSWKATSLVWEDGANVCGNPTAVVDEETGRIWLLMTWNLGTDTERAIIENRGEDTRRVFVTFSDDDGRTWDVPRDITRQAKKPEWGWYATGPGMGIQLKQGPFKGRLVIPCDHSYLDEEGSYEYGSHIIFSDDHGETWEIGGAITPKMNECQVVELESTPGAMLMNMRSYFGNNLRAHAESIDGGKSWSEPVEVKDLLEPVCQAALIRYSWSEDPEGNVILFSNPASTSRDNLTVKMSKDEGRSWSVVETLEEGPSAYSALAVLPGGKVLCLFERGMNNPYEKVTLATFYLDATHR